jgi:hypothetical protein
VALAGLFAVGCGHEQVTGSARNNWATPEGHATATDPVKVDPMAPMHATHDRSVFAKREAPSLQPNGGAVVEQPVSEPAPVAVPPATVTPMPPLDEDIPLPRTEPGPLEAPPPYVLPPP